MKYLIKELPTQEYLKECFSYCEETGILTWKERPLHHFKNNVSICNRFNKNTAKTDIISTTVKKYSTVRLDGTKYFLHRIIWKMYYNIEPPDIIDHINGDGLDNRIINLRTRKLVYGVGINDADYNTQVLVNGKQVMCKYYQTWKGMLSRCYNSKCHIRQPTYIGCTVCEDWLVFSNFKKWMETQDFEGKQLDKDILIQGNKIYSPDTCIFVSDTINSLLKTRKASRGQYRTGVNFNKRDGSFVVRCNVNGIKKHIGCYLTEEEAYQAYVSFKTAHIRNIALEQTDERLKQAMLNYIVE